MNYEAIGYIFVVFAVVMSLLTLVGVVSHFAIHIYCRVKGWPRVLKAMRMLREFEAKQGGESNAS